MLKLGKKFSTNFMTTWVIESKKQKTKIRKSKKTENEKSKKQKAKKQKIFFMVFKIYDFYRQ